MPSTGHFYHHQSTMCPRGDRPGAGLVSANEQSLNATSHQYSLSSMAQCLSNSPTFRPHRQQLSVDGSVKPSCSDGAYMAHSRNPSCSTVVSPSDSFSSLAWPLREGAADGEPRASISPPSPWGCTSPETAQPCSPTSTYMTESMSLSQNYANCDKRYGNYQNLPSPDLDFLESVPASNPLRRHSAPSDKGAVPGSALIDSPDPSKQRQDGLYRGDTQSALLSNPLSDARSQSPILIPELPPSCTEAESHFQDMAPVDGMTLEYLLCSPHLP